MFYLEDNSHGVIVDADIPADSFLIRFDDGIESAQPWRAFKLADHSSKELIELENRMQEVEAEDKRNDVDDTKKVITNPVRDKPSQVHQIALDVIPGIINNLFPYFYHVTHKKNIQTILKYGILSHAEAHSRGLIKEDISDPAAQRWRERTEPVFNRAIQRYTPLYLNPLNPMFYRLKNIADELVILKLGKNILNSHQHLFADGNGASRDTKFSTNEKVLEGSIDVLTASNWTDFDDGKRKRCAEVLIYPNVKPLEIDEVICRNYYLAEELSMSLPLPVSVDESLFFR